MNPFHDYISRQLADRLKSRTIVVWYDGRNEFAPFVAEVRSAEKCEGLVPVTIAGLTAKLLEYDGSFFGIRAQVGAEKVSDANGTRLSVNPNWKMNCAGNPGFYDKIE